jgi:sulfate permease, SulP family
MGACAVAASSRAGVSESAPNPDGAKSDPNGVFLAQGVGNVLSGFFRGQPVGGSVGQTAVSVAAGARTRWAAIFPGVWMLIILLIFSGIVGSVAMSTLAAVLISAALGSLRTGQVLAIMRTSTPSRIGVSVTFVATLFLPVASAVGVGVVLALLKQLNQEALDLRVVELVPTYEGAFVEKPAPSRLESRQLVLLDIYGSLFYAGARALQAALPDPADSEGPAVVLRLRERAPLGATSYAVLSGYAARLADVKGLLYLSGVSPEVMANYAEIEPSNRQARSGGAGHERCRRGQPRRLSRCSGVARFPLDVKMGPGRSRADRGHRSRAARRPRGVVDEAVDHGCGDGVVAEDLAPSFEPRRSRGASRCPR